MMGGSLLTRANVREATVEVTIIRADGRIERLGTVSYWHKNPLKRLAYNAAKFIKDTFK
jgi:hypothetical protein